jgi:AcrR family transcriptional regulator
MGATFELFKRSRPRRRAAGGRPRRPGVTDAILDATIALAAEGGLEDLTLDAIAARAGVGRPTIYRRWASKDALLEDAVDKMVSDFELPETGNIRDDLVEWARRAIERVQSPLRSMWVAYFNLEQAHVAPEALKRARELSMSIVRNGIERGELRADADPDLLVQLIFAMIWYQVTTHHRHLEPSYAETVVDAVLNSWWANPSVRSTPASQNGRASSGSRKRAARTRTALQ